MLKKIKINRVMWLLNHTTLRKFEIPQLKQLGVTEIFTPKKFLYDEANVSASITYEFDDTLNISQDELNILNQQEWYKRASLIAWDIVNRYFDTIFLAFFPQQLEDVLRHFKGTIILRVFGMAGGKATYSNLIRELGGTSLQGRVMGAGQRFWFGMGYDKLADIEEKYIADRAVYLPVGLKNVQVSNKWQGNKKHIFFVCPRISSSPYYNQIYQSFKRSFEGIPYKIGGAQPIHINDPNVLGFLNATDYDDIMQQSRVMFYHSQEPNHIHYHPFEAIRVGMPLIFMAGGMLDSLGGEGLPGRCKNISEARRKIKRLMNGNQSLLRSIKESQYILLYKMDPEYCHQFWISGINKIQTLQNEFFDKRPTISSKKKKIAVIIPEKYKGGTLRSAISLVKAFYEGSRICGDEAEIILAHIDDPELYSKEDFAEVADMASLRPYRFDVLSKDEAKAAMYYAGFKGWKPDKPSYRVLDDGINYMTDCDYWLFVSDRMSAPLLPIKPYTVIVYDYIQRYLKFLPEESNRAFLSFVHSAEKVWVTTKFTYENACQYAGISKNKLVHVPMLAPDFSIQENDLEVQSYFLWTTNSALYKNHINAVSALKIYYEELNGQLKCKVTGFNTRIFNEENDIVQIRKTRQILKSSKKLKRAIKFLGNLPDVQYRKLLSAASFLWAPATIDNGSFSVVEGACLGVPSLSSDYPAMREIDQKFSLNLIWHDANLPENMAKKLKYMEEQAFFLRKKLPSPMQIKQQSISSHSECYWRELSACL